MGRVRLRSYRLPSTMSPDAGGRLVGGRWTLHTPLRRAQRGLLWRATDPGGHPLAIEELHLPTSPVPDEDGPHAQAAGEAAAGGGSGPGGGRPGPGGGRPGPDGGGPGADGAGPGADGGGSGGRGEGGLWDRVGAEVRAATALDHPGLVRLDDVVVEDGVVYVATELVDALTLDELIARHGPLPVRRVAQLGLDLLDALEAAHAAGLPHLDLRPGCVLVTADGRARLAGIGLATLRTAPETEPPTSAFLAPEQVRGDPAGPPADLWSLGTILFLAVEGETPFAGAGSDLTRAAILNEPPSPQGSPAPSPPPSTPS